MNAPLLIALRPLGLGDFLTAIPAYRALAGAFPEHRRILAAPRALHPLIDATHAFDGAIDIDDSTEIPIALHGADVAVDLHGRGPASQQLLLRAAPTRLIAFANTEVEQSYGGARWIQNEHEVVRWCRMLDAYGIATDRDDYRLDRPTPISERFKNVALVHPGAASEARRWPRDRWVRVVRALRDRGETVILTGSPAESAIAAEIATQCGVATVSNLAGCTDIRQLSSIVAHARIVISGDTGIAHLAYAHGTATVTLFGPTPPAHWGPPASDLHRVLWAGFQGDPHGNVVDRGLLAISVNDVLRAIDDVHAFVRRTPTSVAYAT